MLTKRIIPCLDISNGRVVKGVKFENLRDEGDPVEIAEYYNNEGADELVFLDILASHESRSTLINVVEEVAKKVFIPLTVGGGIRSVDDVQKALKAGADKVAINSSALKRPELIKEAAQKFGSQCIVVAIDAKKRDSSDGWDAYINGGRINSGKDLLEWAMAVEKLGAGEILLTSMDADGTMCGYDVEMLRAVTEKVDIPVIASGGAGKLEDFKDCVLDTNVDALLAASLFHSKEIRISDLKEYLMQNGIPMRRETE